MRACEVLGCQKNAVIKISVVRLDDKAGWNGWVCSDHADDSALAAMHWCLPDSELGKEWAAIKDGLAAWSSPLHSTETKA